MFSGIRLLNLSVSSFNVICRLCGEEKEDLVSLFEKKKPKKVKETIRNYVGIKASYNDGLPDQVCQSCLSQLDGFVEFIKKCLKTEAILHKIFRDYTDRELKLEHADSSEGFSSGAASIDGEPLTSSKHSECKNNQSRDDPRDPIQNTGKVPGLSDVPFIKKEDMSADSSELKDSLSALPEDEPFGPSVIVVKKEKEADDQNRVDSTLEDNVRKSNTSQAVSDLRPKNKRVKRFINSDDEKKADPLPPEDTKSPPVRKMQRKEKLLEERKRQRELEKAYSLAQDLPKYECCYCLKVCPLKSSLIAHKRMAHKEDVKREASGEEATDKKSAEKPELPCSHCTEVFRSSAALTKHVVVHGLRPFPCRHCEKNFKNNSARTIHERIHTGERPYVCDLCPSAFYEHGNLRKHYTKVHNLEYPRFGWYRDWE